MFFFRTNLCTHTHTHTDYPDADTPFLCTHCNALFQLPDGPVVLLFYVVLISENSFCFSLLRQKSFVYPQTRTTTSTILRSARRSRVLQSHETRRIHCKRSIAVWRLKSFRLQNSDIVRRGRGRHSIQHYTFPRDLRVLNVFLRIVIAGRVLVKLYRVLVEDVSIRDREFFTFSRSRGRTFQPSSPSELGNIKNLKRTVGREREREREH